MQSVADELEVKAGAARKAARTLANVNSDVKDRALRNIADGLRANQPEILEANARDISAGHDNGLAESFLDRLLLNPERLEAIAADVRSVAALPDPVGEVLDMRTMPNGLKIGKRRVPLGVIGVIYESRPNVTIDISALCLKSGNAVVLRGGSDAINSNTALAAVVKRAIAEAGLPGDAVQVMESTDRDLVGRMLKARGLIDLLIPRGGQDLIRRVAEEATMPAITGGVGVCHTYVDKAADTEMAISIVDNAKVSRPSVCNALDTVIVHSAIAPSFLPALARKWAEAGVQMRCDTRALSIVGAVRGVSAVAATPEDWDTEYLSLTAGVKVVDSLEEAMEHIQEHGSGHSEAIVSEDYTAAMRFMDEVDAAAVFINASTRFNDGGEFGLGAEVAISTNKMHARGPMGLKELTSYKWTVMGTGQVRS
ncbi:MAG: glutamate-5-semialdehyde dehydrogenase [Chloroflexi bacterium]|nr:glutamate-5-semialdehyde dehydrogenase [Chloroflexota bacterium]MCI0795250.1 glutamate-5-semialdehyde dehydrogenase [Chloroflexota bacterium]MCI0840891.1 glutamate-5-semialdehyde dehydrogenase [Chloroflexota bacterium]MCI0887406.1 glutamate-5-semialdehyde dehydrogenase [Chloroflexota bacterium]